MRVALHLGLLLAIVEGAALHAQLPVTTVRADTLIPAGDDRLDRAGELVAGAGGTLYVTDNGAHQVVVLRRDGSVARRIGREGAGPGEMRVAVWLWVGGDTLRFLDPSRGAAMVFDTAGHFVRQVPGFTGFASQGTAFDARGAALVGRHGINGALAQRLGPDGTPGAIVGRLVAPAQDRFHPERTKDDLTARRVPETFRNFALPVLDGGGSGWIVLTVEGAVERIGARDSIEWVTPLPKQILDPLREEMFTRAAADTTGRPAFPNVIQWARPSEEGLWLLLKTPEGAPAELLLLDARGTWRRHLQVAGATGIRAFAVDPALGVIDLLDPSEGTILRAPLSKDR